MSTVSSEAKSEPICVMQATRALGGIATYSTLMRLMQNVARTIITDLDLTPEECRKTRITNNLKIYGRENSIKTTLRQFSSKNAGANFGANSNEHDNLGWIIHNIIETDTQD